MQRYTGLAGPRGRELHGAVSNHARESGSRARPAHDRTCRRTRP
ncbi:hypothetical protein BZL29_2907 [Mycobacterium kansasii]|uniref:Uncharacterized protein n=1 Tax=Mycobacterium kansasii TaxID=1768 RepID=A0A1V3XMV7_MYCKA|nr:hypothetical protein BZL29_2907 [Mycobacterium kansasii]